MKVVFLTLLLGLVCAAQEEDAADAAKSSSISELSGSWSTVYIASNNLGTASQKYLPIRHRIYIVFCKKCIIIMFYVYDWKHHVWRPFFICIELKSLLQVSSVAQSELIGPYVYTYKYNGTNTIEFIPISEKALVAINVNVDETGNKTEQVLLFGKENDIDEEGLQKFKEETKKREISEENIKDLTKPDECVSVV